MVIDDALQSQREQLAAQIGLALARWTLVESSLAFLFIALMDRTKHPVKTGMVPWRREERGRRLYHTVFNAIIGFDTRVDVVSAVVNESGIKRDLREVWPGIAQRLIKKYKARHQIAHFMLANHQKADGSWQPAVVPFPKTVMSVDQPTLGKAEIEHKDQMFREAIETLIWFRHEVDISRGRQKGPPKPTPELVVRVRQSLSDRKRREREKPPSPSP